MILISSAANPTPRGVAKKDEPENTYLTDSLPVLTSALSPELDPLVLFESGRYLNSVSSNERSLEE